MSTPIKLESLSADPPLEIMEVDHGTVTIGREPENHVVVDSTAVSRRHGCILEAQGHWLFKDFDSSNGSWVNGIKLVPGQIRLLRHGDVLKLADFSMRVSEVQPRHSETLGSEPPSLLVFYKENFETEFPLATDSAKFQIGGTDGHFFIEGAAPETVFLSVTSNSGRLELSTGNSHEQVILNGSGVGGISTLTDRDEILVPPYRIVVNDFRSSAPQPSVENLFAQAGSQPLAQAHEQTADELLQANAAAEDGGWVSEASRRRASTGQKFVFGSDTEEDPMTSTLTLGQADPIGSRPRQGTGYEMSASQKFASVAYADDPNKKRMGETFLIIMGVVVFILLIVFVVYLLVSLSG